MSAIELSADLGLVALLVLTANLLLGLLISVRYDPLGSWPRRRLDLFQLHNWTAYVALGLSVAHPLPLLWSGRERFTPGQLAWPVDAPSQPVANVLGAVSLYLLALVVVTSYYRVAIGRGRWKWLHYLSYLAAALFFIHGIVLDPELRNAAINPLDGEKVAVEVCAGVAALAAMARWRYGLRRPLRLRVVPPSLPYRPG